MSSRHPYPHGPERGKLHVELASVTGLIWGKTPGEAALILSGLHNTYASGYDALVIENANEGYRQDDYLFLYGERMETDGEYEQRQAAERWEEECVRKQRRADYETLRAEFGQAADAAGGEAT